MDEGGRPGGRGCGGGRVRVDSSFHDTVYNERNALDRCEHGPVDGVVVDDASADLSTGDCRTDHGGRAAGDDSACDDSACGHSWLLAAEQHRPLLRAG